VASVQLHRQNLCDTSCSVGLLCAGAARVIHKLSYLVLVSERVRHNISERLSSSCMCIVQDMHTVALT
jgi:hypothetical protein